MNFQNQVFKSFRVLVKVQSLGLVRVLDEDDQVELWLGWRMDEDIIRKWPWKSHSLAKRNKAAFEAEEAENNKRKQQKTAEQE